MVDDNPGDLQLIEAAFTDCRMAASFHGAHDYDHAKAHLDGLLASQADLPDVIIIDLSLPTMSGEMIVTALRAIEELREIPLLVFSGMVREDVAQRLTAAGVSRVVVKPKSYKEYLAFARSLGDFIKPVRRRRAKKER